MQRLREIIRGSLARSLRTLAEEDRLAAALPVVCGSALAAHCQVMRLDEARTLHLQVDAAEWLAPLLGMRDLMQHDLQRVAGVPLAGLHFVHAGSTRDRPPRPQLPERAKAAPGQGRSGRQSTSTAAGKERPS